MLVPHRPDLHPRRALHAAALLLALALAGCGGGTPPASKVPEVTIAPAPSAEPVASSGPAAEPTTPPAPPEPQGDPLLGRSKERAIEVCGPPGQRAYLGSLRCADGRPPHFGRTGNVGARNDPKGNVPDHVFMDQMDPRRPLKRGEVDYHIVDLYKVVCSDGAQDLYLDMYHCAGPQTSSPPSGFTMVVEGGV